MRVDENTKEEVYSKLESIDKKGKEIQDEDEEAGIKLMGVVCDKCDTHFFTSCETGKHQCPTCEFEFELIFIPNDCGFAPIMEEMIEKVFNPQENKCPLCKEKLSFEKADEEGCKFICKCGFYIGFDYKEEGAKDEN